MLTELSDIRIMLLEAPINSGSSDRGDRQTNKHCAGTAECPAFSNVVVVVVAVVAVVFVGGGVVVVGLVVCSRSGDHYQSLVLV